MSFCTRPMEAAKIAVNAPMNAMVFIEAGASTNKRIRPRHHIHARRDHGRGVDQGGDRRGAFHGVGQPDVERKLRRLAAGADEQQQSGRGDDGIADGESVRCAPGG